MRVREDQYRVMRPLMLVVDDGTQTKPRDGHIETFMSIHVYIHGDLNSNGDTNTAPFTLQRVRIDFKKQSRMCEYV